MILAVIKKKRIKNSLTSMLKNSIRNPSTKTEEVKAQEHFLNQITSHDLSNFYNLFSNISASHH